MARSPKYLTLGVCSALRSLCAAGGGWQNCFHLFFLPWFWSKQPFLVSTYHVDDYAPFLSLLVFTYEEQYELERFL